MGECTVLCVATAQKNEKKHVSRNRAEPLIQLVTVASPGPTPASKVYWGSTHWTATRPKKTPQKARVRRSARYLSMGVPVENSTWLFSASWARWESASPVLSAIVGGLPTRF